MHHDKRNPAGTSGGVHEEDHLDGLIDPPPLKWSALRYAFWQKEDGSDAEEETQARRDRREAAAG